jgi:hypothetical protein
MFEDVPYDRFHFFQNSLGSPLTNIVEDLNGAELTVDGSAMYYSPVTSDYLCSIETQYLRANPVNKISSPQRALNKGQNLGL